MDRLEREHADRYDFQSITPLTISSLMAAELQAGFDSRKPAGVAIPAAILQEALSAHPTVGVTRRNSVRNKLARLLFKRL